MLIGLPTNQLMPFIFFYDFPLDSRVLDSQSSNNRNVVIDRTEILVIIQMV